MLALVAAVAAVLVVIIKILVETPVEEATHATPTAHSFFLGLGTIMFSFGGAVVFPTIQNDMSDRSKFPLAIMISFCGELRAWLLIVLVIMVMVSEMIFVSINFTVFYCYIFLFSSILIISLFFFYSKPFLLLCHQQLQW